MAHRLRVLFYNDAAAFGGHELMTMAGVRHLTHHDMRRLFATRCIESGVDVPTAARWMGHSDGGALLAKTYFHLLDGHSREMARMVSI